jgi:hypothetical protein
MVPLQKGHFQRHNRKIKHHFTCRRTQAFFTPLKLKFWQLNYKAVFHDNQIFFAIMAFVAITY